MPIVINSQGDRSAWSTDLALGSAIRGGIDPLKAVAVAKQTDALMRDANIQEITTDQLRRVQEALRLDNLYKATSILKEVGDTASSTAAENTILTELRDIIARIGTLASRMDWLGNLHLITRLATADPAVANAVARYIELEDAALRSALRAISPDLLQAAGRIAGAIQNTPGPESFGRLSAELHRLSTGPSDTILQQLGKSFSESLGGSTPSWQMTHAKYFNAIQRAFADITQKVVLPVRAATSLVEDMNDAVGDDIRRRGVTPEEKASTNNSGKHYTTGRGPAEFVHGADGLDYWGWTTAEWLPLIRIDNESDLYCHQPSESNGDRVALIEVSGGYDLLPANHPTQQGFVTETWTDKTRDYWPPDDRAYLIEQGVVAHLHSLRIKPKHVGTIEWEKIKSLIKDELNKDDTKKKIEALLEKWLQAGADAAGQSGLPVSGVAGAASKLVIEAGLLLTDWIIDELDPGALPSLLVNHVTVWPAWNEPVTSYVTWAIAAPGKNPLPLDPVGKDWNNGSNPEHISALAPGPAQKLQRVLGMKEPLACVSWVGESQVPFERTVAPQPNAHINPTAPQFTFANSFMMRNVRNDACYWPTNWQYGAHLFVPLRPRFDVKEDPTNPNGYVLAVRTEVRRAQTTFT